MPQCTIWSSEGRVQLLNAVENSVPSELSKPATVTDSKMVLKGDVQSEADLSTTNAFFFFAVSNPGTSK